MESLFFNTPEQRYQISTIYSQDSQYIKQVDISNGILFLDISIQSKQVVRELKNIDRMVMIVVVKRGELTIEDHISKGTIGIGAGNVSISVTSRQHLSLEASADSDIFILFVADFFLKRYLSFSDHEPIDFLYQRLQDKCSLEEIAHQPLDALSLYLIDKIIDTKDDIHMKSIRCMYRVMEFITHRFALLDMVDSQIDTDELDIASRARDHLLSSFITPPTIKELAHICATNESKLKIVFKKVYKSTIYRYIQKLRLEKANILLREENKTIGEIAHTVGYKHQGHFSKLFFEVYGVHPRDL